MKTFARKFLSVTLAAMMLLSMLPTVAFAANSSDDFYRIVHLDNGRKYYSKEWIIALINEMAADGFTHLQLAFGNDGMRFLLDDMAIETDTKTYSHDDVTKALKDGNVAYYDFGTNELSEAEMDDILDAAKAAGIEIIPLLNNPGHMDAIVTAMNELGIANASYNGSESTINLENAEAVAFTKALVEKYAAYFADHSTMFNVGADEYANDKYSGGSMGFGHLMTSGKYQLFVDYVNSLNTIIKGYGMSI